MDRLGINAEPDPMTAAKFLERVEQRLGHDTLAVVANDDRCRFSDLRFQARNQLAGQRLIKSISSFAVDAHDLLFMRYDARFDACRACGSGQQSAASDLLVP